MGKFHKLRRILTILCEPIRLMMSASGSATVPPGVADGCGVGAPGWVNDGDEDGLEIGNGGGREGDAQGPEGPVDEQAYRSDYDEKPGGLGGTGVIAGPALILPETRCGFYILTRTHSKNFALANRDGLSAGLCLVHRNDIAIDVKNGEKGTDKLTDFHRICFCDCPLSY